MKPDRVPQRGERGIALVIALLVLLVMSAMAVVMVASLNVETKLTGYSARNVSALNTAEAGLSEAMARIRNGDVIDDSNPKKVTQIFLQPPGSVPTLGTDSLALPTGQPVGSFLNYSNASKASDVLTIKYKTNNARTLIYKYDKSKTPPIQTASGDNIFTIDCVGEVGNVQKHIYAEVVLNNITATTNGGVTSGGDIKLNGNGDICGFNHSAATPTGTSAPGACMAYHTGTGDLPGLWSTVHASGGGASTQKGSPAGIVYPGSVPPATGSFPAGPWETLNMTQSQFFAWIGPPSNTFSSATNGLYYLDNNTTTQDQSGSWSITGSKSGLIYADGDLSMNAGSVFRGVIYCEGDVSFNGGCWIIGAVVVRGKSQSKMNGGMTILYSSDTVKNELSKLAGNVVILAWREI